MTFVGFMVTKNCDLIDTNKEIIEEAIMTPQLKESLRPQGIDFEDNYKTWDKSKMISKIGAVMGLRRMHDCDPSYVLTIDNLIKILAIQMRFRYEGIICYHPCCNFYAQPQMQYPGSANGRDRVWENATNTVYVWLGITEFQGEKYAHF